MKTLPTRVIAVYVRVGSVVTGREQDWASSPPSMAYSLSFCLSLNGKDAFAGLALELDNPQVV